MFDVLRRNYPYPDFIVRVETEEEAITACKYFDGIVFYREVTREQLNHEANIFAASM